MSEATEREREIQARADALRAAMKQAAQELRYAAEHYPRSVALVHAAIRCAGSIEYQLEHPTANAPSDIAYLLETAAALRQELAEARAALRTTAQKIEEPSVAPPLLPNGGKWPTEKNWDSYGGLPTDPRAVDCASRLAALLATRPWAVPRSGGGVQIEWTAKDGLHCEIEIEAEGGKEFLLSEPAPPSGEKP